MSVRQLILTSIKKRIETELSNKNPLKFLKDHEPELYMDQLISIVYLYTRPKRGAGSQAIYLTEVISAIGHSIRSKLKQRRDSSLAAKTGAFLLYPFEHVGLIEVELGQGQKGHNSYVVQIKQDEAICALWGSVSKEDAEKLPSLSPFSPWISARHETGITLVKTSNKDVLEALTVATHPLVFNTVNKAQEQGWTIQKEVYDVQLWAFRNKTEAFAEIWNQVDLEAKVTKTREAKAIMDIAKRFVGQTFYHLYSLDFRARKYPTTAYLHEQGSDLAKGVLKRADSKPMTKDGFFMLMVCLASTFSGTTAREDGAKTDKIPLQERFDWAVDNEEILLSYAESPKVNQGWMKADAIWVFLSLCFELKNLRLWQIKRSRELHNDDISCFEDYSYLSHAEAYFDGSNNGSQHLAALTRDEITAPHVNLIPQVLPGDLYRYVANHVWAHIEEQAKEFTDEERIDLERFVNTVIEYKREILQTEPKSNQRKELITELQQFKEDNQHKAAIASPVFWLKIKELKERRKICKRNVMTLPYGGTAYGLG